MEVIKLVSQVAQKKHKKSTITSTEVQDERKKKRSLERDKKASRNSDTSTSQRLQQLHISHHPKFQNHSLIYHELRLNWHPALHHLHLSHCLDKSLGKLVSSMALCSFSNVIVQKILRSPLTLRVYGLKHLVLLLF